MQKETDKYLNEFEAADHMAFSVGTLRNWRYLRRGPSYIKAGKSIRYSLKDLNEFMESQKIEVA